MKVRKEQFLLPKSKNMNTNTSKWIPANMKTGELSKTVSCAGISSQPTAVDPLSSTMMTKIKPDMILSNGDIIVSGQPGGQLFWQQQDGILRQALLSTENDIKLEEKVTEVEGGQAPMNTPTVLTITPVPATQVIKMNDYKVILSGEALPMGWHEGGKKNISSTLPPIQPKVEMSASVVIGKQPLTFAAISNVNVLNPTQYPAIMIKDIKNSLPTNLVLTTGNSFASQNSIPKKTVSKSVPKVAKVRKKPTCGKKIMLKPASSLLSQTALNRTNQDRINECQKDKVARESNSCINPNRVPVDELANRSILQDSNKVGRLITNELPTSSSQIIITTNNNTFSFSPCLGTKLTESNLCLSSNFADKTNFSENLHGVKSTEAQISYESSSISVIGHTVEGGEVIVTSDGCINGEGESVIDGSVVCETVLMECTPTVTCEDSQTMLDTVSEEANCSSENSGNTSNITRREEFHTEQVETILPSDIEHHVEHHTPEYTDNLLSQLQLSDSRVLPNMSCSQVSSVLNALAPSEKTDLSDMNSFSSGKIDKEPVKCEPTEFVKIESLQVPNVIKVMKPRVAETKHKVCELNKHTCFRCVSCSFLSTSAESVEQHWANEHRHIRSELLDRQLTRRQIKCLGCANVVYSKYALQIHLLCDHNVITTEVHELIATTLAANKAPRDLKRTSTLKTSNIKTKNSVPQTEPVETVTPEIEELPPTVYQHEDSTRPPTTAESSSDFVTSESAKDDDQKMSEETQIPPTPNFLFSEMQLPNDKEKLLPVESTPEVEDSKRLLNSKRCARRLRRAARSKLRAEFGCEIKYNFRCMVERCGVRLTTAANLSYHLRCHRPDSDVFSCPECELDVASWSTLTSHLWRHHGTDIDLYCCNLCGYKCNSYSKLINNHIKIHGEERPFLCDMCGKGFKTTKQLRNHKAVHRARRKLLEEGEVGEEGSFYNCKVCSRSFADARILRHHTETVHNKLRPYLCTFCSHTASSKSSLRMHIRSHTGEKPFSCNECDYVTADHNSLRRHKMRHSGLRPYQCPHCSYKCIQATTYKAHLKNKHPGLDEGLMFSCPMCPFRTIKKDNYLAHKAEHDLGGDPRNRRKKHVFSSESVQEQTVALCKTITQVLPEYETVVLLEDSCGLPSVEASLTGAIELIVPEND